MPVREAFIDLQYSSSTVCNTQREPNATCRMNKINVSGKSRKIQSKHVRRMARNVSKRVSMMPEKLKKGLAIVMSWGNVVST